MHCPQCGNEIADGNAFCTICGAQLAIGSASEKADAQIQSVPQANQAMPSQNEAVNAVSNPYAATAQEQGAYAAPGQDPRANVNLTSARNGLGNLFISQVITLASTIGTVVIALLTLVFMASSRTSSAASSAMGIIGGVGLLAGVLIIIAFIIRMVALYQLNKVNERFKMAFYLTIAAIVLSVLNRFVVGGLAEDAVVTLALTVISYILSLAILYMLYQGVIDLAKQVGDLSVASTGKSLLAASLLLYVLGIVLWVVAAFLAPSAALVVALVAAIAMMIPDILLLVILSKGKKML